MRIFSLIFLLLGLSMSLQAQFFNNDEYDWSDPVYEEVNMDDSTDSYYLLEKHLYHYHYNDEDRFSLEKLFHIKVHINSEDAVDAYNKISVSQSSDLGGIRKLKARVINRDGTVHEVGTEDVLSGVDEDSGNEYRYLALEGLMVGSQVEYYYVKQLNPVYKGIRLIIEGRNPVKRFELDVVSPGNLWFEGKVYQSDTISFMRDTTLEEENRIYVYTDSLKGVESEVNAYREVNLAKAVFKLDRNTYNGESDITSYSHTTQEVIDAINREYEKKEEKALKKIIKQIDAFEREEHVSAARKIEDYIKENYQFIARNISDIGRIDGILENKAYSYYGGLRLYTRLFKHYGIPFKTVYTSDRSKIMFDEDFQSSVFLDDLLFYLPKEEDYLDFTDLRYRIGYINPLNRDNKGLFMEEVEVGGQIVGLGEVEYIEPKGADFTIDTIVARVNFDARLENSSANIKRVLSGYSARNYQPTFDLIIEESDLEEFKNSLISYINEDSELKNLEVKNTSARDLGFHPLVATGTLVGGGFIEKAGPNYILKVGTLIGPQVEMYQEQENRKMDIQSAYARTYHRKISFAIPDGYEIKGLDKAVINEEMEYNGDISAAFYSDYEIKEGVVIIRIHEFYERPVYPKELFGDFKRVINAAADFNKVVLLLEKTDS